MSFLCDEDHDSISPAVSSLVLDLAPSTGDVGCANTTGVNGGNAYIFICNGEEFVLFADFHLDARPRARRTRSVFGQQVGLYLLFRHSIWCSIYGKSLGLGKFVHVLLDQEIYHPTMR